jgi:hypothetical protein
MSGSWWGPQQDPLHSFSSSHHHHPLWKTALRPEVTYPPLVQGSELVGANRVQCGIGMVACCGKQCLGLRIFCVCQHDHEAESSRVQHVV